MDQRQDNNQGTEKAHRLSVHSDSGPVSTCLSGRAGTRGCKKEKQISSPIGDASLERGEREGGTTMKVSKSP